MTEATFRSRWLLLAPVLAALAGCVEHAGPDAMALLSSGRAALDDHDSAAAIEKTDAFLAQNARTAEADVAYYVRGLARWRAGEIPAAKEDLRAAAARARTGAMHFKALKALGDLAAETGDAEGAVTLYKQALEETDPNAPYVDEVRYGLGCAYQDKGDWWRADGQFDRLLHDFPDSPAAALADRRIRCKAWTWQIAAHERKGLADDESARLERLGLATTVTPAVADGKLIFLVAFGRYETRAQADADADKVRRFSAEARTVPTR